MFGGSFAAFWQSQMHILFHETVNLYIEATVEDGVGEGVDWNCALPLLSVKRLLMCWIL